MLPFYQVIVPSVGDVKVMEVLEEMKLYWPVRGWELYHSPVNSTCFPMNLPLP